MFIIHYNLCPLKTFDIVNYWTGFGNSGRHNKQNKIKYLMIFFYGTFCLEYTRKKFWLKKSFSRSQYSRAMIDKNVTQ